ncbi:hypothetical protein WME90_11070 [Sorangium sp. So ce375]|uniref:hypothetical protein n=1 Tax=Sorangium sp. So ce375 TaxID=3133306 RepID=UPI003F5C6D6C
MDTTRYLVRSRRRGRRHLPRLCAAALAAAALAGGARQAGAAVTISSDVVRTKLTRSDAENPLWISHQDCVTDNDLQFTLTLDSVSTSESLEVWVTQSTDCSVAENRRPDGYCKPLLTLTPATTVTATLPAKAIAKALLGAEDCKVSSQANTAAVQMTIYFLRLSTADGNAASYAPWDKTKVDLLGPKPPTDVQAHSGDGRLLVDYTQNEADEVLGYYLYCDDGGQSSSGSSGAGQAGAGGGAAGGGDGAGGAGGGATSGGSSGCSSALLVPGEIPDAAQRCGSVGRASRGEATGLDNGKSYVVGVAAYDQVGNAGPLSALSCATATDVDGFFEQYRDAGGQAGGGFCSIEGPVGAGRWAAAPLGLAAAGAALGLWRRSRRRHARARSFVQESE